MPGSFLYYCYVQDQIWEDWVQLNERGAGKGVKGGKKRKKAKKTVPGAPKKNMSAYLIFCWEQRSNNDLRGAPKEQAIELGRRWKALNEDERRGFVEKAKVDKERFEEEMIQFDADAAVEVARGLELEEQVEGGVEVEGGEEGAVELEEEGGVSSKVKLVVMFKEDRNIIRVKESTEMWKIKKKLATHYNLGSRGLVLKHLGANMGDDWTAGSCQGVTLVLEELREGSIESGEALGEIDFEVTIGRFMGLFHK